MHLRDGSKFVVLLERITDKLVFGLHSQSTSKFKGKVWLVLEEINETNVWNTSTLSYKEVDEKQYGLCTT